MKSAERIGKITAEMRSALRIEGHEGVER